MVEASPENDIGFLLNLRSEGLRPCFVTRIVESTLVAVARR